MPIERRVLQPLDGFRSREAALFVAQMDDQNRRLIEDTRGATPAELEWQPSQGTNTIGMLIAHIAIVEVFWMNIAVTGKREIDMTSILGIGEDDDGMPIKEDASPPATLAGTELTFYDDLLRRAREYTKGLASRMTDADLDREWTLPGRSGGSRVVSVRWILYHMLEHEAGHYGQVNLLRHLHRVATATTSRSA